MSASQTIYIVICDLVTRYIVRNGLGLSTFAAISQCVGLASLNFDFATARSCRPGVVLRRNSVLSPLERGDVALATEG